eukprot:TRINITY_DN34000_c1_g1_i3.p1 TRINITY_DN34000_c1_g1~~TRINITY_DN34000_c1_g1_i3.p1  ORF type:complete len:243 (+),score=14.98 TRINITY_DN34000_c1_g1_i3:60-788(+)
MHTVSQGTINKINKQHATQEAGNTVCKLLCQNLSQRGRLITRIESCFSFKSRTQHRVDDKQLTVNFLNDQGVARNRGARRRFYTLTHNDFNGNLNLTIGHRYNLEQLQGAWQKILRDEVLAWWEFNPNFSPSADKENSYQKRPVLHVECHISGEQQWPLPSFIRDYVFQQEIPLVLKCILCGDNKFLSEREEVENTVVVVHFRSDDMWLDRSMVWGMLGKQETWRQPPIFTNLIQEAAFKTV